MWRNWNLCTLLAGMQNAVATVEKSMGVPQTIKNGISMWFSNPTSGYASERIQSRISQRCLHTHVHSSIIHNSQDVEATQVSISRWMGKQNVAYVYNEVLFNLNRKEILSHAAIWMSLKGIMLNEPVTKRQVLYDFTYIMYLEWSESQRQK